MKNKDRVYYRLRTHLEMLQDRVRCLAYRKAIEAVVQDKIVLDVGCGSGILSLFAARAGARLAIGVDMDLPPGVEEVARRSGVADRVLFLNGRVQEIDLPVEAVDIIVSEWMGGLLLMEDMLPAVLYARDRWLKPGGLLLPHRARLFLAPLDNVAGLSSKNFPTLRETISTQMWVNLIDPRRFLAEPFPVLDLDLTSVQEDQVQSYQSGFRFTLEESGTLNGFALWFDVLFPGANPPVELSTAPWLPPTHWAQGLWILPVDIDVKAGVEVAGTLAQIKIAPSRASFRADVVVTQSAGEKKISFSQAIEANPSTMNPSGRQEEHIAEQAVSGAYQGQDCLWIGCSMSFSALSAANCGVKSMSILNHSPWAARAMQQLADQEGLTRVRFLSELPPAGELQNKKIRLLGAADGSWQALLSHIKARRALGQALFKLGFSWEESPWKEFYGFDFSPLARYDHEMTHDDKPLPKGPVLEDITGQAASPRAKRDKEDIIYRGVWRKTPGILPPLPDGLYNGVNVEFGCGTVVLPLAEPLCLDAPAGRPLQKAELTISLSDEAICRFRIMLSSPKQSLRQSYEQPLVSMGHIVRGS
jgi:protein arginine N-methyltransferase 1